MKKIFYLFLSLAFILAIFGTSAVVLSGCEKEYIVTGPNGNNNNGNNNNTGTNENPNAIEYNYFGTVNYNGPIAADPVFIYRETSGPNTVEHYRITWDACPFNPNNIFSLFGINYIRLSPPHVNNSGQTVYYNNMHDANYYFENVTPDSIYFKVTSSTNQTLKMNLAIKTVNTTSWNENTCKWFNHIIPDDGQNNIYTLSIGSKSVKTDNNNAVPTPRNDAIIPVQKSRDR